MSYYIHQTTIKASVVIKKDMIESAFKKLKSVLIEEWKKRDGECENRLDWIEIQNVEKSVSLEELMLECRWKNCSQNEDFKLCNNSFLGQKLGEEKIIFTALAPFIEEGGFVKYVSEGYFVDEFYRFIFKDKKIFLEVLKSKQYLNS